MSIINIPENIESVSLTKDLSKHIKRGHRWVFASSIEETKKPFGIYLLKYKNEPMALGIYQPDTQLKFRILCTADEWYFKKNNLKKTIEIYADFNWKRTMDLRLHFDLKKTNAFRLANGEGDGFPGLIIDLYGDTAVIKHDHLNMETIWNKNLIAEKIIDTFPQIKIVYLKRRNDADEKGENVIGQLKEETQFLENDLLFSSNIRDGAKTGFFLDQRDNRNYIRDFSKNKNVLNLFSYTGGFSIYAAAGGASSVTSVDIAKAAISAVERNFAINKLTTKQESLAVDAFQYVQDCITKQIKFDFVITDPPSFAPNEKSVPQATAAYTKIFSDSLRLVKDNGYFVASSCSSHIHHPAFIEIIKEAFSKAKRTGTLIHFGGQPSDHPFPLAMEELRYLKFAFFRLD